MRPALLNASPPRHCSSSSVSSTPCSDNKIK
jgi:hypothetical protein